MRWHHFHLFIEHISFQWKHFDEDTNSMLLPAQFQISMEDSHLTRASRCFRQNSVLISTQKKTKKRKSRRKRVLILSVIQETFNLCNGFYFCFLFFLFLKLFYYYSLRARCFHRNFWLTVCVVSVKRRRKEKLKWLNESDAYDDAVFVKFNVIQEE